MTSWHRHDGDRRWHTGAPNRTGSFVTLCEGRWSLADVAHGAVERNDNAPIDERCKVCLKRSAALEAERTEVHMLVDYLLMAQHDSDGCPPLMGTAVAKMAREIRRLRVELEERANELHAVVRERVVDIQTSNAMVGGMFGDLEDGLAEAIAIAQNAGRDRVLTEYHRDRLRELARLVPQ